MSALAIFDLDNTLITCDSDVQWAAFLGEEGIFDANDAIQREKFHQDYCSGCLNVDEFLRFQLAPLAKFTLPELKTMHQKFMTRHILPNITATAKNLVQNHIDKGDELLLISATNEFIITPIAHQFGIKNIIGVRLERDEKGNFTGGYVGVPSFREGKVARLSEWLSARGQTLHSFECSYFYSDSFNDLPLLEQVSVPVAVNPDEILAQHAQQKGWRVLKFTK